MEAPCSRCGCERPFHDRWEKQAKLNWDFREQFKRAMAENAKREAEKDLTILELKESQKWMQRKVKKQAEQLRKLEEKLIQLNKQPYAKEETAEAPKPTIPPTTGFIYTSPPNLYKTVNDPNNPLPILRKPYDER